MSATGLRQFDETLHLTNTWLKEILDDLTWSERADAYRALRATLHTIRDHVPIETTAHLSAQLPLLVRGVFFEGWRPHAVASAQRTEEAFLAPIANAFSEDQFVRPAAVASAVWRVLSRHVSEGEAQQVLGALPKAARDALHATSDPRPS